jgi:hypothetical protein
MKSNKLSVIFIFACAVFVSPFFAFAQDSVNGLPFQALQEQIEALQEQVEALQTGPVKAYVTKNGAINLDPNTDYQIMTLTLPEGLYIYTITITASYSLDSQTFLICSFLYEGEPSTMGHTIGGQVNGMDTHALTTEDEIYHVIGGETEVTLTCSHDPWDSGENMDINTAVWTAIKVGELERQNIE